MQNASSGPVYHGKNWSLELRTTVVLGQGAIEGCVVMHSDTIASEAASVAVIDKHTTIQHRYYWSRL